MSPEAQAILFALSILLFVLATINATGRFNLTAAGLAVFVFVFFWTALKAAT